MLQNFNAKSIQVLYHLRSLQFLDHRPVSVQELSEARKPLYGNLQLYHRSHTPLPPTSTSTDARSKEQLSGGQGGAVSKSKQGKRRFKYLGKNSEGNRFIRDNDL